MFRFVMNRVRGTNINYVGTIYRMKMLIELAEVNQFFCIQKPRHCGGVKKSLSGEQRKEAPNVIIY